MRARHDMLQHQKWLQGNLSVVLLLVQLAKNLTKYFQLREVANVPIPRALAWSSDSANPVEAEYIIEEKAPGTRLGSLWHQWPRESKLRVIEQVVDLEHVLTTIKFTKHGCLYFKEDLPQSFREGNDNLLVDSPRDLANLDRYATGPLTGAELWNSGRGDMDLDRGPCKQKPF